MLFCISNSAGNEADRKKLYSNPDSVKAKNTLQVSTGSNSKGKTSQGYDTLGKPPVFSKSETMNISGAEYATAISINSDNQFVFSVNLTDSLKFNGKVFQSKGGKDA